MIKQQVYYFPKFNQSLTPIGSSSEYFVDIHECARLLLKPINIYRDRYTNTDLSKVDANFNRLLRRITNVRMASDLYDRIRSYEKSEGMSSEEFYRKWKRGLLQDSFEYNDWASLLYFMK